jgi:hypothetical protein
MFKSDGVKEARECATRRPDRINGEKTATKEGVFAPSRGAEEFGLDFAP